MYASIFINLRMSYFVFKNQHFIFHCLIFAQNHLFRYNYELIYVFLSSLSLFSLLFFLSLFVVISLPPVRYLFIDDRSIDPCINNYRLHRLDLADDRNVSMRLSISISPTIYSRSAVQPKTPGNAA
jgi:hypothetical protein